MPNGNDATINMAGFNNRMMYLIVVAACQADDNGYSFRDALCLIREIPRLLRKDYGDVDVFGWWDALSSYDVAGRFGDLHDELCDIWVQANVAKTDHGLEDDDE